LRLLLSIGTRKFLRPISMEKKKMEKREYNSEKKKVDEELGRLMEITLKLEDELNLLG